ncbi:hypothetical protein GCM10020367_07990 [Streptomyces sannanensis]|uniref:Maleylpyruvate isomerase family mycothiol-dependent enzyme n=1 Tax=Streptomyces sannanensis TaxID=285536 RepID=A0ABP6S647_9ACTN
MSEALLRTLAQALAHLVTMVDTCDDDVLDPDTAVKWLEDSGHVLNQLSTEDQCRLTELFRQIALREPEGPWREALLRMPDGYGFDHDADERHRRYCHEAESQVGRFLQVVRDVDPATPVPTCPGWTFADLIKHHGTTHRWMAHLVRTGAMKRVRSRDVPLDLPPHPSGYQDWLAGSAAACLDTLRAAPPEMPMWTHGADRHVRFWPRRLLFEAVVHRADAELVLGREPDIGAETAIDGIDEFLENLPHLSDATWAGEPVSVRLCSGDGDAAWTVTFGGGDFAWRRSRDETLATATVRATSSSDLLLLVYGRYKPEADRFTVTGDRAALDRWLSATAL